MKEHSLYSIGHGTRKIEDFIFLLKKYGIQYLLDVRSIPYSRFNPQYRQPALKKYLQEEDITYVFMGDELGGRPKDPHCYNEDGQLNYELVKKQPFFQQGIQRLIKAYHNQAPVAIMCSESKPEECHRSRLISPELVKQHIPILHIDERGELKDQPDVMKLIRKSKDPGLFDN